MRPRIQSVSLLCSLLPERFVCGGPPQSSMSCKASRIRTFVCSSFGSPYCQRIGWHLRPRPLNAWPTAAPSSIGTGAVCSQRLSAKRTKNLLFGIGSWSTGVVRSGLRPHRPTRWCQLDQWWTKWSHLWLAFTRPSARDNVAGKFGPLHWTVTWRFMTLTPGIGPQRCTSPVTPSASHKPVFHQ